MKEISRVPVAASTDNLNAASIVVGAGQDSAGDAVLERGPATKTQQMKTSTQVVQEEK